MTGWKVQEGPTRFWDLAHATACSAAPARTTSTGDPATTGCWAAGQVATTFGFGRKGRRRATRSKAAPATTSCGRPLERMSSVAGVATITLVTARPKGGR